MSLDQVAYERLSEDMVGALAEVFENLADKTILWRTMVSPLGDVCLSLSKSGIWEPT